ncbi:MAG: SUMF1/EgtB/PvdO family nonheme iron enzyme [Vulcanimicrobiota bacterium]
MKRSWSTVLLVICIVYALTIAGCGGGGGRDSVGYNSDGGGVAAGIPALTAVNNLSSQGQSIRPGDWIEVNGSNFGSTQCTSYVGFTNGTTTEQAVLYDSWSDIKIVCRVPEGTPMSDRYAVREITNVFVSTNGVGNSNNYSSPSDSTPNPTPQPTPPSPTPTPSPTSGGVDTPVAAKLGFKIQPCSVQAGTAFTVTVEIQDANGNRMTSATNEVTMAIATNPGTSTLSGTVKVSAVKGTATFNALSLNKTGTGYTLDASATGLTGSESTGFDITPGPVDHIFFNVQPVDGTAGVTFSPALQVEFQDALGNRVIAADDNIALDFDTNPGGSTLSGTLTRTAVSGVATFDNLSLNKTGTGYKLKASVTGMSDVTSNAFNIVPAGPHHMVFSTEPSNTVAGASITPSVKITIQDSFGNTVTTATNEITVAVGTDPGGPTLSGTTTVAAINGVATFGDLSLNKTGNGYTLIASAAGFSNVTSGTFNITPAGAHHLDFSGQPSNVQAGSAIAPAVKVEVQDQYHNRVTTATNNIAIGFGENPSGSELSGTKSEDATAGEASFSTLSLDKTGTGYTLAASASGLTGTASGTFNVTPGPVDKLYISVQPSNGTAGVAVSPAIQVELVDTLGNRVTTATNTITVDFGNNPGTSTLSGSKSKAATAGVASFGDISLNKSGTGYTLLFSSAGLSDVISSSFNISPAGADHLAFVQQPSNIKAGAIISPSVTVEIVDSLGNRITTASNDITLSIPVGTNPRGSDLSGTVMRAASSGLVTFNNISLNKTGTGYTLQASATGFADVSSGTFNVTPGAAHHLTFTQDPRNVAAGASITPAMTVEIRDANENLVTSATDNVTIAILNNPGRSTPSGTTTRAAASGVATFEDVSLNKVSTGYTLQASATGITSGTSGGFNVTPGTAHELHFLQQPTNVDKGTVITPAVTVEVYDSFGNKVTTSTAAVTMAIQTNPPGDIELGGNLSQDAVSGTATFNDLTLNKTGTGYVLRASGTGLTSDDSSTFDVNPMISSVVSYSSGPNGTGPAKVVATPNGDAGTNVDINGFGFGGTQGSVKFIGPTQTETTGIPATVTNWADDKIVCTVPTGAEIGTGTVYVKKSSGVSEQRPFIVCPDGMTYVPAGKQGSETDNINALYMGECEVTNAEFRLFLTATSAFVHSSTWYITPATAAYENYPVEAVSWYEAVQYCNWKTDNDPGLGSSQRCYNELYEYDKDKKGYRLGNNAGIINQSEWEYACRAGKITDYYWGESGLPFNIGQYCWFASNSGSHPNDKGQKIPNLWGLYDMSGNVWEWTNEKYGGDRVIRGGCWGSGSAGCLSSFSEGHDPLGHGAYIGFRFVRTK